MHSFLSKFFAAHSRKLIALGFSAYGLYLRFQNLAARNLWLDELNQIQNTAGAFKPFWLRLTYGERTCFPGDYLLTYPFVQMFPDNKWGMAIPHILSTVLGFYLLYLICQKHLKTIWAFAMAFAVMCFNSNLIFHAFELRPYAVLTTLGLAAFHFSYLLIYEGDRLKRLQKILVGAFFTLTVAYHAYGIMIVFFSLAFFLFCRTQEKTPLELIREHFTFLLALGLAAGPIFWWYAAGNPDFDFQSSRFSGMSTFDYIPNPLIDWNKFMRQVFFGGLIGYKKFKFLINGITLALLLPQKNRFRQLGFFMLLVLIPIELKLNADLHKGYWFLHRQFVWIMPLFAFYLAWCWDSVIVFVSDKSNWKNFPERFKPWRKA